MRKGRLQNARKMAGTTPNTIIDKIASGVGTVATIARTVSGIASMINVEDKYLDFNAVTNFSSTSPSIFSLNDIAQGSDYNQRNGNKVLDKCLQIHFKVALDPTATALDFNNVRVVLLIDKKPQVGAMTWGTVYTPADINGFINKNTAGDRVIVLKDYRITINGSDRRSWFSKFYCSLSRIHTQYTSSTATDFEFGRIYLMFISDVAGMQPATTAYFTSRFCYMDN